MMHLNYCNATIFLLFLFYLTAASQSTTQNVLEANAVGDQLDMATRNADSNLFVMCPNMIRSVFENAVPRDESKAGKFELYSTIGDSDEDSMHACLAACCEKQRNNSCNVVFVYKRKCYHVRCFTNEACVPKKRANIKERLQMFLVNPVRQPDADDENVTWLDFLKGENENNVMLSAENLSPATTNTLSFWRMPHKFHYPIKEQDVSSYDDSEFPISEKHMKQLFMSTLADNNNVSPDELAFYDTKLQPNTNTNTNYIPCDLELGSGCPVNEKCVPVYPDVPTGVCKCSHGFYRNERHECVLKTVDYQLDENSPRLHMTMAAASSNVSPTITEFSKEDAINNDADSAKEAERKKLVVSVVSKQVRLPEKEVTLAAFTVPDEETANTKYNYLWTLISQPKGPMNGTISDQSKAKVRLSNLSEGLYTFRVTVTGANDTFGEATANVTVLPEARINRVPQAIIKPPFQILQQPTSHTVLDGSISTDDDKIVSWQWEVVSGPIGYQPKLPNTSTLQLTDLTSPGNYTFKLTVTDSDNEKNSTTANIIMVKATDYPPVANAGEAVILFLPNNNVTLNGTASTDDHEIVAWEWTKDASDETKAVDMQNTRTPYVQLSNLEEGMYTFVLKVTDESGQFSTAKVNVFVKQPTNSPPISVAGQNNTINLPLNWALLNGSQSTDDIRIERYNWKQVSGPNTAAIKNSNTSIANATSLTLGLYEFELFVTDASNNTASDKVWVKVVQEKNAPPVANAGGDKSVTLPISALYLNGSKSSDDLAIVKYAWSRDDSSLAAGVIVGDTNTKPVLILTNLVHGRYVFKLTVSDEQGLTNTDTISVIVHPDPMLMYLVELTLPMSISNLAQSELNSVVQKIALLLGDMKIHVRELKYDSRAETSILVIYVESAAGSDGQTNPVEGLVIEQLLKDKLQRDVSILGTVFADVRTTVCQNKCSGHGVCNTVTRNCICEAFWMSSFGYYWGVSEPNCDWSILYVFVSVIMCFLLLSIILWGIVCACKKSKLKSRPKARSRPKVQKYSLIGNQDEEGGHFGRVSSLTDSDTDSDVLFETRTKPNGILRLNGNKNKHNNGQNKYAITKLGRKVKT
ncbi:dyslexia-associated protein KIAA0319-like protein [Teleopsis dalmanni]|uniref:dyslexia-associated protein KIAA0319-like protein n=1 Tax=Teleopsis dalmanni TaxID=139649 RepID=UPI0018CE33D6|nr:dyslexia-associated protein KIAA0319-like protein [Teleopsis dalmanni]